MAHHFRIKPVPHKNKDGSDSKSKRDWQVLDRTRQGTRVVGIVTTKKAAENMIDHERAGVVMDHAAKHPNDHKFLDKHGMGASR